MFSDEEWLALWRDVSGLSDRRREEELPPVDDSREAIYKAEEMFDRRTTNLLLHSAELVAVVIRDSGAPELARDLFVHLLDDYIAENADGAAWRRAVDWARRGGESSAVPSTPPFRAERNRPPR